MIKQLFSFVVFFSCCAVAAAQKNQIELGFGAGINFNSAYGKGVYYGMGDDRTGIHINGDIKVNLTEHVGLKAVPAYDQYRWKYYALTFANSNGTGLETGDLVKTLNYLNLPLLVEYASGNKIRFTLNGGVFVGFLLSNSMVKKINSPSVHTEKTSPANQRPINFGLSVGAGIQIPLTNKIRFTLGLRNNLGLSNTEKDSPVKINALTLSAGLSFTLR